MIIANYPKLHHLGFKFICGLYIFNSIQYMNISINQQAKMIRLLEDIRYNK
jgi:hypothetical protein